MMRRRRQRLARGFTLVELMVALSGGLFLSMVVFALARDTNRFYQQQTRLANATMSGLVGFDRLRADIARAGYLSTPNIILDPRVCSRPGQNSPERLKVLRSLWLRKPSSAASATLTNNGITPMELTLAGAFTSTDEFPIRTVFHDGTTAQVFLQVNTGPMARLGYLDAADQAAQAALLSSVFKAGRILRILDKSGQQHYGVIESVAGGAEPSITLAADEQLTFRANTAGTCGLKGLEVGATVNVVNVMRYDVRSVSTDPNYAPLFDADAGTVGPYDDDRTELVRVELDAVTGDEIDGTLEVLAEYAVDFQLGYTVWTGTGLVTRNSTHQSFSEYFGAENDTSSNMQRVRAVRARLSVRSREADRATDVDNSLTGLYRIGLGPGGGAPFARVRTFQADIALHNHGRTEW